MMKNKIPIIISFIVLILIIFTGGVYVFIGPQYEYDFGFETIEEGNGFIPRYFHLTYNASEIPLIPILLHIICSRIPKDLNINNHDITYLKRHKGFSRFKIEKLSTIYDNGKIINLIDSDSPEDKKIIKITDDWKDLIIIKDAIKEKSGFKYHIEGVSFSSDGKSYPFKYVVKYKYSYGVNLGTRFQKWASI